MEWNVTNILDGVGKRPPDMDPNVSIADAIKEVRRRGKLKMQGQM